MAAVVDLSPDRVLRYFTKIAVGFDDEHWPWLGSLDRKGYAQFRVAPGRTNKGHIFGWVLYFGPIPNGLHVDHVCQRPWCQNPACWRLLTNAENNARSSSPSAINARKTACIRGHDFDKENTRITANGARVCRTCERNREIARNLRVAA